MKRLFPMVAALILASCTKPAGSAPLEKQAVLLELFTSQGCSSCPPADQLLSKMARKGHVGGVPVIALAYHVDYWNYLGWRDPFSAKKWTTRQRRYAAKVANGRVYTPQLIINGRDHAVGSRPGPIVTKVRALASIKVIALQAKLKLAGRKATVTVRVPRGVATTNLELVVALYENGVQTSVPKGENAGRSLRNDHVVRALERVSPASQQTLSFSLSPTWRAGRLGAVAFLRDRKTLAVIATVRAKR